VAVAFEPPRDGSQSDVSNAELREGAPVETASSSKPTPDRANGPRECALIAHGRLRYRFAPSTQGGDHIGDEPWDAPIVAEVRRLRDAEAHDDEPFGRNDQDKLTQAAVGEERAWR
jgi:hypothetical protein